MMGGPARVYVDTHKKSKIAVTQANYNAIYSYISLLIFHKSFSIEKN